MILHRKDAYISSSVAATATRTDSGRLSSIDDSEETISSEDCVCVFLRSGAYLYFSLNKNRYCLLFCQIGFYTKYLQRNHIKLIVSLILDCFCMFAMLSTGKLLLNMTNCLDITV